MILGGARGAKKSKIGTISLKERWTAGPGRQAIGASLVPPEYLQRDFVWLAGNDLLKQNDGLV